MEAGLLSQMLRKPLEHGRLVERQKEWDELLNRWGAKWGFSRSEVSKKRSYSSEQAAPRLTNACTHSRA